MKPATYDEYHAFAGQVDYQKHQIDAPQFIKMTKDPAVIIADLRSQEEYDHQHIKGAVHLGSDVSEKTLKAIAPSKDTTIILYCNNSLRPSRMVSLTSVALPQALYLGYKNTYVLGNGMGMGPDDHPLPMEPE